MGPTIALRREPRDKAHGKDFFPVVFFPVRSVPCAAHGKASAVRIGGFAVRFWHTATGRSPVVHVGWAEGNRTEHDSPLRDGRIRDDIQKLAIQVELFLEVGRI